MNIPQQATDIVKRFEGFSPTTYFDSVGVPTIGFGTTAAAGVGIVPVPGMEITEKQAEKYLRLALEKFARKIRPLITEEINDNEWSAFLSLAYNIGPTAFRRSTALRKFNEGDKQGAARAILMWNKAGGKVLRGLQRRRNAEMHLFLKEPQPQEPWLVSLILSIMKGLISWMTKRKNL